ncbi:MAG: hypothetical protein SFW66_08145 [Gammaproteobacteria bacterium]|nr:hypothetical protein [Gammaproteobacteria bacterium]
MKNEMTEISLDSAMPNQIRFVIQEEQRLRKKTDPQFYCYVFTETSLKKFLGHLLHERQGLSRCQVIYKTDMIPWSVVDVRISDNKYEFLLLAIQAKDHQKSLKHSFDLIKENFPADLIAGIYCISIPATFREPVDPSVLVIECARRLSLLPFNPFEMLKKIECKKSDCDQLLLEIYEAAYAFEDGDDWDVIREELLYVLPTKLPADFSPLLADFNSVELFSIRDCMAAWEEKNEAKAASGKVLNGFYTMPPEPDEVQTVCWPRCVML